MRDMSDNQLRLLERQARQGDRDAHERFLEERERTGSTGLAEFVSSVRAANETVAAGARITERGLRELLMKMGNRGGAQVAWLTSRINQRRGDRVFVLGVRDVTARGEERVCLCVGTTNEIQLLDETQRRPGTQRINVADPASVWSDLASVSRSLEQFFFADRHNPGYGGRHPNTLAFVLKHNAGIARDPRQRESYFTVLGQFKKLARGDFAAGTPLSAGFSVLHEFVVDDAGAGPHGGMIEGLP